MRRSPDWERWSIISAWRRFGLFIALLLLLCETSAFAATVTVTTNRLGSTPSLLAYNSGHFYPGSNTRDWWRYSGVTGARLFISPDLIESNDDIPGRGDGVTNQTSFVSRRTALRAQPLNSAYINWSVFTNGFRRNVQHGSNILQVEDTCTQLKRLGVEIMANIGASPSVFPISDTNDWAGKWELWQHYYAEAFYLARNFGVQRYQMYNEPNISGVTEADYLTRLQITSDAIQAAVADVNQMDGKTLVTRIVAPVTAGSAISTYSSWGKLVITNRHENYLGQIDPNFFAVSQYDYHQYNSVPSNFGSNLSSLNSALTTDLSPEPRMPISISEFNVHTASTFDTLTETLESPTKYSRFGAIVVNLVQNLCDELFVFKFSQTLNTTTVKKNGMHYVDNTNAPYNIGGVTKAGEVWRLFNKAATRGRDRYNLIRDADADLIDMIAVRDSLSKSLYLFSANQSTNTPLTFDFSEWDIPTNAPLLLEEVSETFAGAGKLLTNLTASKTFSAIQPSNTVWLLSLAGKQTESLQTFTASNDATVVDGTGKSANFGSDAILLVRNNSTNTTLRQAALLKFHLPPIYTPDVQLALLSLNAASIGGGTVQAYVYGLTNNGWSQSNVTWQTAPNLAQGVPAGSNYINNFVTGLGDGALMLGELVANSTSTETLIDVTEFVRKGATDFSFLITRPVRFHGDVQDNDGILINATEGNPSLAPKLKIIRLRDTDGDGVSDDSETGMFQTNPNQPDTDGDGMNDGDEVFAGTNATSSNSVFRVLSINAASSNTVVQWSAVTNRSYRVLQSGTLDAVNNQIFSNIATNSTMTYTTGASASPTFLRIEVQK